MPQLCLWACDGDAGGKGAVPAMLDAYGWQNNARREHAQLLLSMTLRAVAAFRSNADAAEARTNLIEVEGRMQRARDRLTEAVERALSKHGAAVLPQTVEGVRSHVSRHS